MCERAREVPLHVRAPLCVRCGARPTGNAVLRADDEVRLHHPIAGQFVVMFRSGTRRIEVRMADRQLRLVPLFCSIGELASKDRDALLEYLSEKCDASSEEVVFVYPDALRRDDVTDDRAERWLAGLRHELPVGDRLRYSLLPVSPWRVGSLDDIGRALNWFLLAQQFESVPPKVRVPADVEGIVGQWPRVMRKTEEHEEWALLTPTVPRELKQALGQKAIRVEEIQHELDAIDSVRKSQKGRRRGPDELRKEHQRVQQLKTELPRARRSAGDCERVRESLNDAERAWRIVQQCPVCDGDDVVREQREDGFWCVCSGCQAEWGTQRCASCRGVKPCVKPHSDSWTRILKRGDSAVRVAGADLLSAPVLDSRETVVFCCPHCGRTE